MNRQFQHRNLPMLLLRARESVMRYFRPTLKQQGLTEQQWRVIRVLNEHGEMETGRIAEESCILAPSLSGVLERMERDGLIVRHRLSTDQRKVYVDLTAHSKKLVRQISKSIESRYLELETLMGQTDLLAAYALLDKLIDLPLPPEGDAPVVRMPLTPSASSETSKPARKRGATKKPKTTV